MLENRAESHTSGARFVGRNLWFGYHQYVSAFNTDLFPF